MRRVRLPGPSYFQNIGFSYSALDSSCLDLEVVPLIISSKNMILKTVMLPGAFKAAGGSPPLL